MAGEMDGPDYIVPRSLKHKKKESVLYLQRKVRSKRGTERLTWTTEEAMATASGTAAALVILKTIRQYHTKFFLYDIYREKSGQKTPRKNLMLHLSWRNV